MSMGSKRSGWRAMRNRYNYLTRDLQNRAAGERAAIRYVPALEACLKEIEQFHNCAYPKCDGGCPAHAAMALARTALGQQRNKS